MKKTEYKPRIIDNKVEKYLSAFGAVCIEGPKWCGKTWTAKRHSKSCFLLGDPEGNFQNRKLAEFTPSTTLEGLTPRLLDEWQEVPSLWDAVRHAVDARGARGQFLLTGSATPIQKGILHSGAGRIAALRMRPMSLYELGKSTGEISLEDLCKGKLTAVLTGDVDLKNIAELIVRGGWPGSMSLSLEEASLIPKEYLVAVINNDIRKIDFTQRDTSKMWAVLKSLARNESSTASDKTIFEDITTEEGEVSYISGRIYLDLFRRLFLLDDQPPFATNVRSKTRLKKAVKRHLADPSLACALLNLGVEGLLHDLETFGLLFEALCERDLRIYAESFGANLYHYQDYANNEIDAVIELKDGTWCAVEIKLGANQIDKAAANLLKLQKAIASEGQGKSPTVLCVICGLSCAAYQRDDGVFVVPITALKN